MPPLSSVPSIIILLKVNTVLSWIFHIIYTKRESCNHFVFLLSLQWTVNLFTRVESGDERKYGCVRRPPLGNSTGFCQILENLWARLSFRGEQPTLTTDQVWLHLLCPPSPPTFRWIVPLWEVGLHWLADYHSDVTKLRNSRVFDRELSTHLFSSTFFSERLSYLVQFTGFDEDVSIC